MPSKLSVASRVGIPDQLRDRGVELAGPTRYRRLQAAVVLQNRNVRAPCTTSSIRPASPAPLAMESFCCAYAETWSTTEGLM